MLKQLFQNILLLYTGYLNRKEIILKFCTLNVLLNYYKIIYIMYCKFLYLIERFRIEFLL
jgi:hypothetical protein